MWLVEGILLGQWQEMGGFKGVTKCLNFKHLVIPGKAILSEICFRLLCNILQTTQGTHGLRFETRDLGASSSKTFSAAIGTGLRPLVSFEFWTFVSVIFSAVYSGSPWFYNVAQRLLISLEWLLKVFIILW